MASKLTESEVNAICEKLPIEVILGQLIIWDKRKSNIPKKDYWGSCPYHDETSASFHVDGNKGFYYCFGCHEKGNARGFIESQDNPKFIDALRKLAFPSEKTDDETEQIEGKQFPEVIEFVRKKDYKFLKELGHGACGETILLEDPIISEKFVCKKYSPIFKQEEHPELHKELFGRFMDEIKILYKVHHPNIVRVFNYHVYDEHMTAYIIMEFIEGENIFEYMEKNPENCSDIFEQVVEGFCHLQARNIIHRDIRPDNILVHNDGIAKVIDFGFSTHKAENNSTQKSISLNWWCDVPNDFQNNIYDMSTEVYFIGKIFEKLISNLNLGEFKYTNIVQKMCNKSSKKRFKNFNEVQTKLNQNLFDELEFSNEEISSYRNFSNLLTEVITKVETGVLYRSDNDETLHSLINLYNNTMLEEYLPNPTLATQIFISGSYYYKKNISFPVSTLKNFLNMFKSCNTERRNIITSNLLSKLRAIPKYDISIDLDDEIPF